MILAKHIGSSISSRSRNLERPLSFNENEFTEKYTTHLNTTT